MICSMKALLSLTTILLVACAAKPTALDPQVIEPDPTTEADENAQTAADRRFAEETRGYRRVERNGQKYYCRAERASGSNLRTMNCFTENELRVRLENAEAYRRRSKADVCGSGDSRCGGD